MKPTTPKLAPTLAITATLLLTLAGCNNNQATPASTGGDYDEPGEFEITTSVDAYNEQAEEQSDYANRLTPSVFEALAKTKVCDQLPDAPDIGDYQDLADTLEDERDMHHQTALALTVHGSGTWCRDKFEHAFEKHIN